jgi:hypothetical protein
MLSTRAPGWLAATRCARRWKPNCLPEDAAKAGQAPPIGQRDDTAMDATVGKCTAPGAAPGFVGIRIVISANPEERKLTQPGELDLERCSWLDITE